MNHGALTDAVAAVMRKAADEAILPRFRALADGEIVEKSAGELVTVADREAEAILSDGLEKILPEASIVGEEAADADPAILDRLSDSLTWIIDPIDGTHNYAHGHAPFGILIALAEAGETVAGWIYDPLRQRLCHAARGEGAFIDGERFTARPSGETPPIAAISLLFVDPAKREALSAAFASDYRLVDIPRCAAEQYPRIGTGENDISLFERTLAWDHAAGILWLNEAGGRAARIDGSAYRVDDIAGTGLIAAASPALWDEAAARMP